MKQDNVVRILFVLDQVDDAEQVISILRNAGIAVRPASVSDAEELEKALGKKPPDLVLVDTHSKKLDLAAVQQQVVATGKDIAVLLLAHGADDDILTHAMEQGAGGVALLPRPVQLAGAVKREFEALSMRRRVRQLRAALSETERRCDALLENSNDAIAYVHEGMHVRANKAYLELFGMESFEDVEGMTLLDMIAPEDATDFKQLLKRISKGEPPPERLEAHARRSDDTEFEAVLQFANATYEGEPCIQIIFRQHIEDNSELRWRDATTGLFNRSHMLEAIDKAVVEAAGGRENQALLLIEPDNYRATLDTVGLSAADQLLHGLASVIADKLGDRDAAGRITDHGFAVLLTEQSKTQVNELAETIRSSVEQEIFEAGAKSVNITVSIGGSLLGEKNAATQELLDQATEQLRAAQSEGGNKIAVFNPAAREQEEAEREQRWVTSIQKALAKDEFTLFGQGIISLQGAESDHLEVLLRLDGPNGEILPSAFLPAARRNDLMSKIDLWVLNQAIALLGQRIADGQDTTFMIKLSRQSLGIPKLPEWIAQQLKAHKIPPASLVLEMPESKVMTNIKPAAIFARKIRQIGCSFALEQFGTGLKSFQLLQHIDANYLKIDRSFLKDLPDNEESQAKIREICEHAREQERLTIAEWVEDASSTSILFGAGVDFVQGNFLQEPERLVPVEAMT